MFETASLGVLDMAGYAGVSGFDPVRHPEIIIKEVGYLKLGKYNYMSIGVSNKDLTIYILITISQEDTFGIILGVRGKSFLERKLKMQTLLNSIKSMELYKI
ncbi:hypothetical protein BN59_02557 [Legionella massiliensis]|uniref:Uncharacterized protein n=1 Tax=Legionella massiliensis TaxID=1034943 RepID=A0A078KYV4_9GAMM|nr:hypothetical protein [Legionella massiliensis]CDZ78247.1 hypothetical protein BN59_02557 [Legionella massiliensis]CEE13985.1 hypothetical protein BN1094_02557 [Legionella massiliensis]